tara:strand:+ start:1350 stop:1550 length:201 start_codon:yes stop_codon:yes gene_type:complete
MSQLEIFLDNWIIHRPDGSAILNGKPEDFAQGLKEVIALQKIEMLRELISTELNDTYIKLEKTYNG